MNQKSSLREVPQMVSGVLTANSLYYESYGRLFFGILLILAVFAGAYFLWRDERIERLKLEGQLTSRIAVSVHGDGIVNVLTGDLSGSIWVQVCVTPATSVALHDCEVHVTGIEAIRDDGTSYPLIEEYIFATWSDQPAGTVKINIPPGVTRRSNLVTRYETSNYLTPQLTSVKHSLIDMLEQPGIYDFSLVISARETPSEMLKVRLHWGYEWDDIALRVVPETGSAWSDPEAIVTDRKNQRAGK